MYVLVTCVLFPTASIAVTEKLLVPMELLSSALPFATVPEQVVTPDPASEQE